MLEDPSAKTTIEEGKSTAVESGDVVAVETAKEKEEENEKNSEKAKHETERQVENAVATTIENGGDSSAAATDSCTSDVSDMRICDAAAAGVISAHSPEAGERMPPSSDPDSDVITRDCNAMSSEARGVITSSLSEQVTIDLTQEIAESSDTIIDLTAESTTADTGGTVTATAGLIIDLTTDSPPTAGESEVSKSISESSAKSRRSKRAPLAVYVPPRGRGPPPASGATATKKTSAAESVLVPALLPPSVVATEDAPGVDVTEQVI